MIDARNNPNVPSIKEYHSILWALFIDFGPALEQSQFDRIYELFTSFKPMFRVIESKQKITFDEMDALLGYLDRTTYLLKLSLQGRQYFFKMGKMPIKGFENAIKIIEKGGGIFGGNPIKAGKAKEPPGRKD
jgi:hypothetical protein